jgi:hypothetical protein
MDRSLDTNQTLPVSALPNFLRGVSQFKKSGVLDFSTLSEKGTISFYDGRIVSLSLFEKSCTKMFLERLCNGGVLPPNVYELLIAQSHRMSIDELVEVLESHSIIHKENIYQYYDSYIQEFIFKLLEAKIGEISFSMKTYTSFSVDESDLRISLKNETSERGVYPCQLLLDYVESTLLVEELCFEGEYLSLLKEDTSAHLLLDSNEKRLVAFAKAGFSICQVLDSVCESRQAVYELLIELRNSGVLVCAEKSPNTLKSHKEELVSEEVENEVMPGQRNPNENTKENVPFSKKSVIERVNMFLMKPEGIEWVLRIVVPFGIFFMLLYFHIAVKMLLNDFSLIFSI